MKERKKEGKRERKKGRDEKGRKVERKGEKGKERKINKSLDKTGWFCWGWDCSTPVQDRGTDWSHVKIFEEGKRESTK